MLKNYYHICNQCPPICLIAKFCATIRIPELGTKNALFGCFGQQFRKTIAIFATRALEFVLLQSLVQKIKILKFGTKIPDLRIRRLKFENIIVIFKASILKFVLSLSLVPK